MKFQELEKIRIPNNKLKGITIVDHKESDKYGDYSTGVFRYKGKFVVVNIEDGKYHLSVSANHPIGYYELKEVRYAFLPNRIYAAQILPPREEFVNLHENCYHLWEVSCTSEEQETIEIEDSKPE